MKENILLKCCLLFLGPGERDLIILRHEIDVEWLDGCRERRQVGMTVYGETNGYSAMAKTVGLPTGIATKMVLEGWCVLVNIFGLYQKL